MSSLRDGLSFAGINASVHVSIVLEFSAQLLRHSAGNLTQGWPINALQVRCSFSLIPKLKPADVPAWMGTRTD